MVLDEILKYGVLIGSRAYGVSTENSDYDIVLTEDDYYIVCEKNDLISCKDISKQEDIDGYVYSIFGSGLDDIGRFISDDGFNINVFLFTDSTGNKNNRLVDVDEIHIYDRFKNHNKMMCSHSNEELKDRENRINIFIDYLIQAGITETSND